MDNSSSESFEELDAYFKRMFSEYSRQWALQIDREIMGTSTDPEPEQKLTIAKLGEAYRAILTHKLQNPLHDKDYGIMHPNTWHNMRRMVVKVEPISWIHDYPPPQTILGYPVYTDPAVPEGEIFFAQSPSLGYRFRTPLWQETEPAPAPEISNVRVFHLEPWMVYILVAISLIVITLLARSI